MDDLAYYEIRMRQEKAAARIATSEHVRECHEELASAYGLRCRLLREENRFAREQRVEAALESQSL